MFKMCEWVYIIGALEVLLLLIILILIAVLGQFLRNLKRERHRLDRVLNRFNRTYCDDYDFYNGF